jgi:hypothetical protein
VLDSNKIGPGEEVAIFGLFRSHYGVDHNVPIVRVGHIASIQDEMVHTEYCGYMEAYLVEAMSIAGLSGSPVYLMRAPILEIPNGVDPKQIRAQRYMLLGLMHGHYDIKNLNEDVVSDDIGSSKGIHTGLGVVVPVEKILETIEHPDFKMMRANVIDDYRKKSGATPDVLDVPVESDLPNEKNPKHREGFNSLVDAAARKPKQDDQT